MNDEELADLRRKAEAAELESDKAQAASDADPDNEELYQAAEAAYREAFWANQALPVSDRYPDRTKGEES